MKINPQDVIITNYPVTLNRGFIHRPDSGVKIYHKPSGLEVAWDKERSQHKNKSFCLTVLEDLLTEFNKGDIVITRYGIGEITTIADMDCCFVIEDGTGRYSMFETIAHTEQGFLYKKEQALEKGLEKIEQEADKKRKQLKKEWGL